MTHRMIACQWEGPLGSQDHKVEVSAVVYFLSIMFNGTGAVWSDQRVIFQCGT